MWLFKCECSVYMNKCEEQGMEREGDGNKTFVEALSLCQIFLSRPRHTCLLCVLKPRVNFLHSKTLFARGSPVLAKIRLRYNFKAFVSLIR